MKIPPYWITEKRRASDGSMWKLRGISYRSMEEARERLEERARLRADFASRRRVSEAEVDAHCASLRALDELQEEDYSVLLLEPVLETLDGSNVITRNRYGVQVLNSTSLCFVDVDTFPLSLGDTLRGLFGRKVTPEEKLLQRLRELCMADPSLGARLYRTHHGWRVMLVGDDIAPDSPRMQELFKALHADALYESLCARQQCWRARLTPKPYRVGITCFPRPQDSESIHTGQVQTWLQKYEALCQGKAVCRLVDCLGRPIQSPMVELHDSLTLATKQDLPLA
jgi:hypothetical protein